jgi:phosphohistidine phosphatase
VIWLLRHGAAEDADGDDAARPLTEKGRRQAVAAGKALVKLGVEIDLCLASPKLRAIETARIACEALAIEPRTSEALRGGDFDLDEVAGGGEQVLLVGHEPDFSRAVHLATGARIELKKGGVAAIDGALLACLLRPAQLRRIAGV